MSMLDRYRKTGGFLQLLKLLETCEPVKKEKLMAIVRAEDSVWADALAGKMLSYERILLWNDDALAEIVGTLQDLTVAIVLHGSNGQEAEKIKNKFTQARMRKVEQLFATTSPTASEILSMKFKMVETVRQMATDGYLRLENIDPDLHISDNIEDHLGNNPTAPESSPKVEKTNVLEFGAAGSKAVASEKTTTSTELSAEVIQLRKKVQDLGKENAQLRHEMNVCKVKLEQIKKII